VTIPAHHRAGGGFRNPWPTWQQRTMSDVMRWRRERRGLTLPPIPLGALSPVDHRLALPRTGAGETRITWVGHATFLIQAGGVNLLTDPVWSPRVSPVSWAGPMRLVPPGIEFDELPPIDAVLLSHDHYDHLDSPTIRRLAREHGPGLEFFAPLGYTRWLRRHGAGRVRELDWWQSAQHESAGGTCTLTACPVQHWTRRTPFATNKRLWSAWSIDAGAGAKIYFGGDSGWCPAFAGTGERVGPFDVTIMPIGAYEPRWFMEPAHMNPEEAVQAWQDLGGRGRLVPMHWGTFVLTDEPVLEPPARLRSAWQAAGCPESMLSILRHGETLILEHGPETGTS
jgi:N-acyl-phosphatidylethanolamine-hydrolysing phospholipase D